jgi:hypothetical protein
MVIELERMGIKVESEVELPIFYRDQKVTDLGFRMDLILNTSGAKMGHFLGFGRHGWSKGLILLDPDFCSPENATNIWCGKYAL